MANFRSFIVYVFALLFCKVNWASAGTSPLSGSSNLEPVVGTNPAAAALPPQQTRPQHHYSQMQQQLTPQLPQKHQETGIDSSSSQPGGGHTQSMQMFHSQQQRFVPVAQNINNNAPSTLSLKNGFGFSTGSSNNGPYTSGFGYVSGRTLSQPSHSARTTYMTDYDLVANSPPTVIQQQMSSSNKGTGAEFLSGVAGLAPDLANFMHGGVDFKSVLFGALLGAGASMLSTGTRLSDFLPFLRREFPVKTSTFSLSTGSHSKKNSTVIPGEAPLPTPEEAAGETLAAAEADGNSSSRRRRNIEFDTDLTELASMVLSAVQSGECMQRSICLMGSRIGSSNKGKMGFFLVDKLIPESVQGSQYFVTLKKALRGGESYCDRFRCRFN